MALVAVSEIKIGTGKDGEVKVIQPGENVTKSSGLNDDQLKELVAAGAVAPPKSASAEAAKEDLEARQAAEERASQAEAAAAEAERARAEAVAAREQLEAEFEAKLAEALAKQAADAKK